MRFNLAIGYLRHDGCGCLVERKERMARPAVGESLKVRREHVNAKSPLFVYHLFQLLLLSNSNSTKPIAIRHKLSSPSFPQSTWHIMLSLGSFNVHVRLVRLW